MPRKPQRKMAAYFCPVCGREFLLEPSIDWMCPTCGEMLKTLKLPYQVVRRRRDGGANV